MPNHQLFKYSPVIKLEVINGRMSIFNMRISRSPGNERIIIVSVDGFDKRTVNPRIKPQSTPTIVNVRRRLSFNEPTNFEQHYEIQSIESRWKFTDGIRYSIHCRLIFIDSCSWWTTFIIEHRNSLIMFFIHNWILIAKERFSCKRIDINSSKRNTITTNLFSFVLWSIRWKNDSRNGKLCAYMMSDSIRPRIFSFFIIFVSIFQLSMMYVITMREREGGKIQ